MYEGRIMGIVKPEETTVEEMGLMMGGMPLGRSGSRHRLFRGRGVRTPGIAPPRLGPGNHPQKGNQKKHRSRPFGASQKAGFGLAAAEAGGLRMGEPAMGTRKNARRGWGLGKYIRGLAKGKWVW